MEHVLNITIIAILLAQIAFGVAVVVTISSKVAAMMSQLNSFVSPVSEGQPSPLAATAETVADMLARAIMARAKMTFAGLSSGAVRGEKAVEGDIAEDVARQNPIIDGLLDSFPTLRKTLRKNPALLDMAVSKLMEMNGKSQGRAVNGQGSGSTSGKISG